MGIVDWFRRTFVPLRKEDERFGHMLFLRMRSPKDSYWECSGTFAGRALEFFVDADEQGPIEAQREHVRMLEARWSELEPRLARFLAERARPEDFGERSTRLSDWKLGSLTLPRDPGSGPGVEVGYTDDESGELLTFEIEGLEPRAVYVGG